METNEVVKKHGKYQTCRCGVAAEWDAYKNIYVCETCGAEFMPAEYLEQQEKEKQEVKVEKGKCVECKERDAETKSGLCHRCYQISWKKGTLKKGKRGRSALKTKGAPKKKAPTLDGWLPEMAMCKSKTVIPAKKTVAPADSICHNCEYDNLCKYLDRVTAIEPIIVEDADAGMVNLLQCVYKKNVEE